MYHELAKKLNAIDPMLSILINTDGKRYCLGVYSYEMGELYSYSSMDASDSFSHLNNFIDCLSDSDKFNALAVQIKKEPLEV